MAALGRFVRSGRETLCLVRARGDALALETLFLAEDVYSQAEIDEAVADVDVKEQELQLARQVIESLEAPFESTALVSEYRRDLRALLEAKLGGEGDLGARAGRRGCAGDRPDGGAAASVAAASGGGKDEKGSKAAARPRKRAAAARKS